MLPRDRRGLSPAQIEDLICARLDHEQRQFNRWARLVVWAVEYLREGLAWAMYSGVTFGIERAFGGHPEYSPRHGTYEQAKELWESIPGYDDRVDKR